MRCLKEKSQIQALDRTQATSPMKPGRAATMTHDYERHATMTLFAALDVLTGKNLHREIFHRMRDLITNIEKHLDTSNDDPKPTSGPPPPKTSSPKPNPPEPPRPHRSAKPQTDHEQ